jgi:formamidopyrimidine-DNA glycosylase
MPELPEVETIRRQLDKVLAGQEIRSIEVLNKKSWQGEILKVIGKKILGVKRKAKMIWVDLEGESNLLIHLKMTGQLLYENFQNQYTRAIISLDKGRLLFNDLRIFGWIKVVNNEDLRKHFANLPPDVIDEAFTVDYLQTALKSSGRAVKLVLLDQQKIGGIGNIYANEALFCAAIRPTVPANKVKDFSKLHQCIVRVIKAAIKHGGTTASDENFVNVFNRSGGFQKYLKVYENKGGCFHCGAKIKKIKLGGRGTYFCPSCQK